MSENVNKDMTRKLLRRIGVAFLAVIVALKSILGIIGDAEVIANFGTPGTLPNNLMRWFVGLPAWGFFLAGVAFVALVFWDQIFASASVKPSAPEPAKTTVVRKLVGGVDETNFEAFCDKLSDSIGNVIGLHVGVSIPTAPKAAELGDGGGVYLFNGLDMEVNASAGAGWRHGEIIFDGFWMVKNGGMGQGISSVFLDHIADAAILLNPAITIVEEAV